MNIPIDTYIEVYIKPSDDDALKLLEMLKEFIAGEVRAKNLQLTLAIPKLYKDTYTKNGE